MTMRLSLPRNRLLRAFVLTLTAATLCSRAHALLDPERNEAPVDAVVLLQRSSSPAATEDNPLLLRDKRCVAVVVADGYLLAQASCVAQLQRDPQQPLKFAEFGVLTAPPIDGSAYPTAEPTPEPTARKPKPLPTPPPKPNTTTPHSSPRLRPPLPTRPPIVNSSTNARWLQRSGDEVPVTAGLDVVSIRVITYHPQFAPTTSADSDFVDHDFAVIEYAHEPMHRVLPQALINNTAQFVGTNMTDPNFGLMRIDRATLAVTWLILDVTIENNTVCGFDPATLEGQRAACVRSPRLQPTGRDTIANNNTVVAAAGASTHWTLLFHRNEHVSSIGFFLGFASGASKIPTAQPLHWAYGAFDLVAKPTVYGARWSEFGSPISTFPGVIVTNLPNHLAFVAGLRMHKQSANFCGGSLIGSTFVLTAAHCVDGAFPPDYVSVGSVKTSSVKEGEQIKVQRIIRHPQYDSRSPANDLALIELVAPSVRTPVPILNTPRFVPKTGTVFGYGAMDANSDVLVLSENLRYGELAIIARNAECEKLFQEPVDKSMFCAGGGQRQKDTCVGDSGGPLLVMSSTMANFVALAGVVSYGRGECGVSTFPGVYANVTSAEQFIRQHVIDARWTSELVGGQFPSPPLGAVLDPTNAPTSAPTSAPSGAPTAVPIGASPVPASVSPIPTSNSTITPSGTRGDSHTGGGSSTASPSTPSSTKTDGVTPSPSSSDNKFQIPANLSPQVKDEFINFLVGATDQISSSRTTALLQQSSLVLRSTQSLGGIEAVLSKYSVKALNQRATRFQGAAEWC